MTQAIDTELKELIQALDKKIDLGFANVDRKLEVLDTRLIEVEKKIDKQDVRLWSFAAIILAAALGVIVKLLSVPNV